MALPGLALRRRGFALAVVATLATGCGGGGVTGPLPSFAPGIVRGPMVALPAPGSMTIAWTSEDPVVGSVEFGLDATYGTTVTATGASFDHVVALRGLLPATTYHYRIALGGAPAGEDHVFTTPPTDPFAPVRFGVIGDTGTGEATELAAIARLEAEAPDFVLHAGDLAYDHGTELQVLRRFTIPFASLMSRRPLFAALGNHDVATENGRPFLDAVVLPTNPVDGGEKYYSTTWGGCHVAVLDGNSDLSPASAQMGWLAADLAASPAPWKFVLLHHPVWSSSDHGGRVDLQASLAPVCEAHGVDVVFSGHDHDYERSYPMVGSTPTDAGDEPDYTSPAGPVYVVTGGGGQTLYDAGKGPFTAVSVSAHHVTIVDVAGSTLTVTAVALDGTVLDRATISK